jgi:hypothetical protein
MKSYLHEILNAVACRDPLLGNDRGTNSEIMPAARQQILDKQQLNYNRETMFFARSVPRCYKQDNWSNESVRTLAEDIVRIYWRPQ